MIERKRAAALDAALSAMFRVLKGRPVPERIQTTLEELEAADEAERQPQRKRA